MLRKLAKLQVMSSVQEFYAILMERLFFHLGDSQFGLGAMTEGLNMDFDGFLA